MGPEGRLDGVEEVLERPVQSQAKLLDLGAGLLEGETGRVQNLGDLRIDGKDVAVPAVGDPQARKAARDRPRVLGLTVREAEGNSRPDPDIRATARERRPDLRSRY